MKKKLKPVELFLAASLATGLVACGPSATTEGDEGAAPETTEEVAPEAEGGEGGEGEEAPAEEATDDEGGEGGEG